MEWVPQCFGTPEKPALAAFCVSEADAGSDAGDATICVAAAETRPTATASGRLRES